MKVEFKFSLDQKVTTPFGESGLISMLAVDDGGNTYYVKTKNGADWFKESQLSAQ